MTDPPPDHSNFPPPRHVSDERERDPQDPLDRAAVMEQLAALPDANTDAFLVATRSLAAHLPNAVDFLPTLIRDSTLPIRVRFNALYLLLFRLRRLRDFADYRAWVDDSRREFGGEPLFHTFDAVYHRSLGEDRRNMERAIRASRKALTALTDFPGVLHQFAELVASHGELHYGAASTDLHQAEAAVKRAIDLSSEPQPHFWATLGRIQALQGEFDDARRCIAEAIELEPSSGQDYALRLTEYQIQDARISFLRERERSERRDREAREELHTIRGQLLEVLGLLAAIIAFIVTAIGLASGKDFRESSRLLLLEGGIITCVFAGFAYMFRIASLRRVTLPLLLGAGLVASALLYSEWSR